MFLLHVLGMLQVLQIVDRQHDRATAHGRSGSSTVVNDLGAVRPSAQPCVFGENSPGPVEPVDGRHLDRIQLDEFGMCLHERRHDVERREELGAAGGEADQLPDQILLGAADVSGDAPQQVDRDVDRGEPRRRRGVIGFSAWLYELLSHGSADAPPTMTSTATSSR